MGAKKNKDLEILDYEEKKAKKLATAFRKYNISQLKITKMDAKEAKYKKGKKDVQDGPDY